MQIRVCMAKIHRATVTDADLGYVGSITIDEDIVDAAGLKPFQMVLINNTANAVSWQTYILPGKRSKGDIILNGPPARLFQKGDVVIIVGEAYIDAAEYKKFKMNVVFVDGKNKITKVAVHKYKTK